MAKGVEILLVIGTRIPDFIQELGEPRVQTSYETYGRRRTLSLRITDAEAGFIPGGQVDIGLGKGDDYRVAFEQEQVFAIRELPIGPYSSVKRNRVLCPACGEFSGEGKAIPEERRLMRFTCRCCEVTWNAY